jgi:tetratricopeptide (TPR) repeat protein
MLVLAARALAHMRKATEAISIAEQGFGTSVDATARQIAGSQHEELDEHTQAQLLLSQALLMHRLADDHLESARDAYWLAGLLLRRRRLAEAMVAADTSISEAQLAATDAGLGKEQLARSERTKGYAYRAQADVFTAIGDARAARTAFAKAGTILGAWPQDAPWVLLKHGMFVLELDDTANAVELLTSALEAATRAGVAAAADAALLNLARAEHALGHFAAAQHHLDALRPEVRATASAGYVAGLVAAGRGELAVATRLLAAAAANPVDDDYAADIAYQRGVLAERAGDLTSARELYRASIDVVERIRERTAALDMRPWTLARRRAPYEALFVLSAMQHRQAEALEIAALLHARTWLDVVVATADPRERPSLSTASAAPLSTEAILAAIGDREVLIYVDARGALWRIHVDGTHIVELAQLSEAIGPLLESWISHPDDPVIAETLGAFLVPADLTASARPLYLVTSDRLAKVPFAALRRSQHYLIEDRPLVRLPRLAVMPCRRQDASLGEPVLIADSRGDLSYARHEVVHVAAAVHGRAHVGAAATIARVVSAHHARLLHAAVHATVDRTGGVLDLWDGVFTATDVIAQGIGPQVAVLAGCETGVSHDIEGWGALPSALLVAGTRTVVATLHPIGDEDAALVMKSFYDAHGAEHPATALATAQRVLAASAAPHVWAWFAVWGDAEPRDCREASLQAPR